ncbi:MAG: hypothetical protein HY303_19240 [Candidatus Wallbacteria bacterium]|nr:hypothetical protein [Candidatus Wallbacteria bacterium]
MTRMNYTTAILTLTLAAPVAWAQSVRVGVPIPAAITAMPAQAAQRQRTEIHVNTGARAGSRVLFVESTDLPRLPDILKPPAAPKTSPGLLWRSEGILPGVRTGWSRNHPEEAAEQAQLALLWQQRAQLVAAGASASQLSAIDAQINALRFEDGNEAKEPGEGAGRASGDSMSHGRAAFGRQSR